MIYISVQIFYTVKLYIFIKDEINWAHADSASCSCRLTKRGTEKPAGQQEKGVVTSTVNGDTIYKDISRELL